MGKNNFAINAISEIKNVLEKNDYIKNRYNKDVQWFNERSNVYNENIIRVALIGITSSGKSTLVNVLLGEKILPMAIRPSSSIIITASKGTNRQATVYFNDKSPVVLEGNNLNEEVIGEYADERKNPNNILNVTQIDITTPGFLLDKNIHIIDSPGLDAWNLENHEKLTLEILLPTIDICIFLTTVKANSDETNMEKIKIVHEKEKKIILVQNMIDSIEEKIGKNGTIQEDKIQVLLKHKKRAENLLRNATNNNNVFQVVQISALNALKGIIKRDRKLYETSNVDFFIKTINNYIINISPNINEKRVQSIIERINQIISTDNNIINENKSEKIKTLKEVRINDINEFAEKFQTAQEKILLKIKKIEEVILNTISEISSSESEEIESYLDIIDRINNKNLYIESDILNIVKDCEQRKNQLYERLNLSNRIEFSYEAIESRNIDIKHKYEEKTMLYKKEGMINKGKRLLSNLFNREWGYKEIQYDEKVVDKEATIEIAENVCIQKNMEYLNVLKDWSMKFNKSINIFYDEVTKRAEEYKEKKAQNIEISDIEEVNNNLKNIIDKLKDIEFNEISGDIVDENSTSIKNNSYNISKTQYNIFMLSNEIFKKNYLLLGNFINQKHRKIFTQESAEIYWTWDIDSCLEFIFRMYGISLNEKEVGILRNQGIYKFNNIVIVNELCNDKLNLQSEIRNLKVQPYNMYLMFNGIQIGNSKKQILESKNLKNLRHSNNIIINFVIDSLKLHINGKNLKELLKDVYGLRNTIDSFASGYVLINSRNPIYNFGLIECEEKDNFLISDYRDIKEMLFKNPLCRGGEERETLEEILSFFLNSKSNRYLSDDGGSYLNGK